MPRAAKTLSRYGLRPTEPVRRDLIAIGIDAQDTAPSQQLLAALSHAGRPELALQQIAALATALRGRGTGGAAPLLTALRDDASLRTRMVGLFGASETLAEHFVAHPDDWTTLMHPVAPGAADAVDIARRFDRAIRDGHGSVLPVHDAVTALRRNYRTALAGIAAADVSPGIEPGWPGPTLEDICHALTGLADALVGAALTVARAAHPAPAGLRLAVIAMGKCGARELNYVSDVDVLFIAGSGPGAADLDPATMTAATAQATELMRICELVAWEVDAGLRPEGRNGPLVRSLESYAAYYQRWAKTWEYQALLKARPAAGDVALGAAFVAMTNEQVWSAADRDAFVTDVQSMRRRVEDAVPVADRTREFKLGAGGLRDVEFAVQLLQLVHGRTDESLRVPGTLDALRALTNGGYVGRHDGAELADAYTFQRRLEHLLQLQRLRRTHSLPATDADLEWVARVDGFRTGPPGSSPVGPRLTTELTRHAATVRRLHEKLFYRPLLAAVAAVPTDEWRLTTEAAAHRLTALGFAAPASALQHLAALTDGVSRRAAIQRTLLPVLLGTFADAPDPDAGLLAYRQVSDALASTPWFLRLLRDEGLVAQRLARLLGTSRLIADLLQRAPEVVRLLVHDRALVGADAAATSAVACAALKSQAARSADAWAAARAARSARRHEMARLACADVLGLATVDDVASALTAIAEVTVTATLDAAHRQVLRERPGAPDAAPGRGPSDGSPRSSGVAASPPAAQARIGVIGMGRFGGAEMGYSSDADVLFVVEPASADVDPADAVAEARAVAELTVALLDRASPDPPLHVDADLRPGGRGGPLVRTTASYRHYWARNIQPWERQALLRARAVGGDETVTARFLSTIEPLRYPPGALSPADVREIRRIKARVDTERLPRGADPHLHTKLGRGGLADIEWTVQLLQLRYSGAHPALRSPGTLTALRAARADGLLSAQDADALAVAWRLATRARNAIMLVTGRPGDEIPAHGRVLAGIAEACGYAAGADPGVFVDDYRRATRRARRVVDRLFDGD